MNALKDLGTHVRKEKDHAIIGLQDFPLLLPQRREGLTKPFRGRRFPRHWGEMTCRGPMSLGGAQTVKDFETTKVVETRWETHEMERNKEMQACSMQQITYTISYCHAPYMGVSKKGFVTPKSSICS